MDQLTWTAVDDYFSEILVKSDKALEKSLKVSTEAGLPYKMHVSPNQGKLLELLVIATQAKRILEIGTLGGYSTIWLARGMQKGGHIVTLEYEPSYAAIAEKNIQNAGFSNAVEVRIGLATESLQKMVKDQTEPFDLVFIDADKPSYQEYLEYSIKLTHHGSMIIADNVVRKGEVANNKSEDSKVQGMRQFIQSLGANENLQATAIQMVGSKGYDGFSIAIVK